jgi:hypothetical protein
MHERPAPKGVEVADQPTRHHIFIGPGGGPGAATVGFDQIVPLNSEIPRVLIERRAISAVSGPATPMRVFEGRRALR